MGEAQTRREKTEADNKKYAMYANKMKASLSDISKNEAGVNVLRYLLHSSGFLAPLTHETAEGINKDLLLQNEAKRVMYLGLRVHMDTETIRRVELNDVLKDGGE